MYHSFFICEILAEKMKDPEIVQGNIDEAIKNGVFTSGQWRNYSLVDGMPTIGYFYSVMHEVIPDKGWDRVAERYFESILESLKKNNIDCSLFDGMSGIALALFCSSKNSPRYTRVIAKLDEWLIDEVKRSFLNSSYQYENEKKLVPAEFYNIAQGLSGVIQYFLARKDSPYSIKFAQDCIEILTKILLCEKQLEIGKVPAWYLPKESLFLEENKEIYPLGGFISSCPYGITGCLITLSIAAANGVFTNRIFEAIKYISTWLMERYSYILENSYWNSTISAEGGVYSLSSEYDIGQYSWMNGWPPVARGLFLAGRVLKDPMLIQFAENIFSAFLKLDQKIIGSSFCVGIAGFMTSTYLMAKESENPKFFQKVNNLKREIIDYFDPNVPFGFQQPFYNAKGQSIIVNSPGFLYGSVGIALSLLLVEGKSDLPLFW